VQIRNSEAVAPGLLERSSLERLVVAIGLLWLSTDEEHTEASDHRAHAHAPDDDGRNQRHERCYLVGEHPGQNRGEDPDESLYALPRW
jgi:hypothetical protein